MWGKYLTCDLRSAHVIDAHVIFDQRLAHLFFLPCKLFELPVETHADRVAESVRVSSKTLSKVNALVERLVGGPQRPVERNGMAGKHAFAREHMANLAAKAQQITIIVFGQHAATIRADKWNWQPKRFGLVERVFVHLRNISFEFHVLGHARASWGIDRFDCEPREQRGDVGHW